jgi:tetratricopeptide (TPR) repeat protein
MQENDEVIEYAGEVAHLALADEDKGLAYNRIGLAYFNKGEYGKAIEYDEKSLAIYLEAGGPDDPNVALNYNNIGLAYTQKGEYAKAIGYFEKTLALYFKTLGSEHPEVATTYNQLGLAYFKTGEYDRAVECNEKALAIRLKAFGPEHPYVGMSYGNLGSLYAKMRLGASRTLSNKVARTSACPSFVGSSVNNPRPMSNGSTAWT